MADDISEYVPPVAGEEDARFFDFVNQDLGGDASSLPAGGFDLYHNYDAPGISEPVLPAPRPDAILAARAQMERELRDYLRAPPGVVNTMESVRAAHREYSPYYLKPESAGPLRYLAGAVAAPVAGLAGGVLNLGSGLEWLTTGAGASLWTGEVRSTDYIPSVSASGLAQDAAQRVLGSSFVYASQPDNQGRREFLNDRGEPMAAPDRVYRLTPRPDMPSIVRDLEAASGQYQGALSQLDTAAPSPYRSSVGGFPIASQTPAPSQAAGAPSPAAPKTTVLDTPAPKQPSPKLTYTIDHASLTPEQRRAQPDVAADFAKSGKSFEQYDAERLRESTPSLETEIRTKLATAKTNGELSLEALKENPAYQALPQTSKDRLESVAKNNDGEVRLRVLDTRLLGSPVPSDGSKSLDDIVAAVPANELEQKRNTYQSMLADPYRSLSAKERDTIAARVAAMDARLIKADAPTYEAAVDRIVKTTFVAPPDVKPGSPTALAYEADARAFKQRMMSMGEAGQYRISELDTFLPQLSLAANNALSQTQASLAPTMTKSDGFRKVQARTGETLGYDMSTILAAITTGIGLYSALVQTPKSQKDAQDFEMKMARTRMKYEQSVWDRNIAYANSRSGGGSSRAKRQPSAVAPVRF